MNKFKAIKTTVDGITFASRGEATRYAILRRDERIGLIHELELQPKFPIAINGVKICTYIADFKYFDGVHWIVEDFKGFKTREYILKRKLMKAVYGIEIKEVTK